MRVVGLRRRRQGARATAATSRCVNAADAPPLPQIEGRLCYGVEREGNGSLIKVFGMSKSIGRVKRVTMAVDDRFVCTTARRRR